MLVSSASAQISPTADAAAPGTDSTAARNLRTGGVESQGRADQAAPDRVVITGSFIPTAEGEGALPVANFTQDDLRKLGATSAVEGLRRLPSFVGTAATENNSNGGNGGAGINLRGLGQVNTLVLINGHRVGNPGIGSGFNDVNAIPFGAIDHVEVLKDGASATYGSDAVAGVVNFVLKTTFDGTQIDFQYGNTTNNDNSTYRASVLTGFTSKDKRFNIVANANYYQSEAIFSRDRFLSSVADARRFGGVNTESGTYPGRATVSPATATALGLASTSLTLLNDVNSNVVPTSPTDYRAYSQNGLGDGFNFRDQTPTIPKQQRFAYYGAADYQIVEKLVDVYAYGLYSNNRQYNSLASSPFNLGNFDIDPQYNPGLAAQFNGGAVNGERALIRQSPFNPFAGSTIPGVTANSLSTVNYRTLEAGPRASLYDTRFYNFSGGVKGEIKTFTYDAFLSHVEDKQVRTDSGDTRRSVIIAETAAGNFNPFIGANAPKAGTVTNANGTFSYDNVAALGRAGYLADTVTFDNLNLAELRLTNAFFPDAPQGGFAVALTGEYRRESFDTQSDPVQLTGDQLGFNAGPSYHAVQDVRSIAGELNLPIISPTMNIPGLYSLTFTVAGRYQKFQIDGTDPNTFQSVQPSFETTNPKYAVRLQPIPDITLRASYSTSFRAPALTDLFAGGGENFPSIRDPFGGSPSGSSYQPILGDPTGGNPGLQPETTDSYTAGIVLTPRFIKGLNITVDYYQLNQGNLILPGDSVSQLIIDQNYASSNKALFTPGVANAFNDPGASFASSIRRDPADGTILSVDERSLNAAKRLVEGIDVTAYYELDTLDMFKKDLGKFNFTLAYNHFLRFKAQTLAGQPYDDFNGNFNDSGLTPGSIPFNKGLTSVEYTKDLPAFGIFPKSNIGFITVVNYIGDYQDQPGSGRDVREYTTVDLQLNYTIKAPEAVEAVTSTSKDGKDGKRSVSTPGYAPSIVSRLLGGTTFTVGVVNVGDKSPPFVSGQLNDNYDTSLYSIRNRFVYGGFSKKF